MDIGIPELIIILVIVMLLFGVGRLPEIGGALGKSIRNFKQEVQGEERPAGSEKNSEDQQSS